MTTALIELGFHSNPDDSVALRNTTFQIAATRGIEKGYRMFKAGETDCLPFKIVSILSVAGKYRMPIPFPITLQGHPRFPVTSKSVSVICPKGWTCPNITTNFNEATNGNIIPTETCNASDTKPAATFRWKTTVTDADGIVTGAVEHDISCSPATT